MLETVVSLAIMGIIAVTFLTGLATIAKTDLSVSNSSEAESVATSQMEYVKSQNYINYAITGHADYELISVPSQYNVTVGAVHIDSATGQPLGAGQDNGVQIITVTVNRQGQQVISLQGYKVNR